MKIGLILILGLTSLTTFGQKDAMIFGKWKLLNHEKIDTIALNEGNVGFLYVQAMSLEDQIRYVRISKKNKVIFMPVNRNGVRYSNTFQFSKDKRDIIINLIGDEKEEYEIHHRNKKEIELINKYNNRLVLSRN